MKPKNKLQKHIIDLKNTLKPLTKEQKKWALDNHKNFMALSYSKKQHCLECGHNWEGDNKEMKKKKHSSCPKCKSKLQILKKYSNGIEDDLYYSILETCENYQVVRVVNSVKILSKGNKPKHKIQEVLQHWVDEKGKRHTISKPTHMFGYMAWADGDLEFRTPNQNTDRIKDGLYIQKVYPKKKVLPVIKRNGFKGGTHGFWSHILFENILSNPKFETLFKAKQYDIAYAVAVGRNEVDEFWDSIKIVLRNGYKIQKLSDWFDYLKLLKFFNKDLRNPFFVCPVDLKKSHDKYVKKKKAFLKEVKYERMKASMEKDNKAYRASKKPFFALEIKEKDITIEPLRTVEEFYNYGEKLGHCLFTNEYHKKLDSLILVAKIADQILETIEISLTDFRLAQSRGLNNSPTPKHKKIVSLVNSNIDKIKEIALKQAS